MQTAEESPPRKVLDSEAAIWEIYATTLEEGVPYVKASVTAAAILAFLAPSVGADVDVYEEHAYPYTGGPYKDEAFRYRLMKPQKIEPGRKYPLILFLHGAGERGTNLELVKKHGPPKIVEKKRDFPFVVVSPQCPRRQWWSSDVLAALLDEMIKKYRVDADRVYLTGLSMGGFGTWALAAKMPDRFAAIVPICGGGDPAQAAKLKDLPIRVFHGARDRVVNPSRSRQMVEAIKAAGGKEVELTVYPNAGHDSWTKTYDDPELYKWLLKQKRKKPAPSTKPKKQ